MQEDARDNLVTSEKKTRELEAQLQDEQLVSANNRKVPGSVHGRLQLLHLIIFIHCILVADNILPPSAPL